MHASTILDHVLETLEYFEMKQFTNESTGQWDC